MTDNNEFPFVILSAPEGSLDLMNVFVTRDPSDALRMTDIEFFHKKSSLQLHGRFFEPHTTIIWCAKVGPRQTGLTDVRSIK